jgi:hypothetical protein
MKIILKTFNILLILTTFTFLITGVQAFNFEEVNFSSEQNFNFGPTLTTVTWTGNLTNFSQMADSDTGDNPPNDGEGLTWSASLSKWVATILDSGLIWKKVGNIISPLNESNLDMGNGNITANNGFINGSLIVGDLNVTGDSNIGGNLDITGNLTVDTIENNNGAWSSNATCPFIVQNSTGAIIHTICN